MNSKHSFVCVKRCFPSQRTFEVYFLLPTNIPIIVIVYGAICVNTCNTLAINLTHGQILNNSIQKL